MRSGTIFLILTSLLVTAAGSAVGSEPRAILEIDPLEATVGDPLQATLNVFLPPGDRMDPLTIGPELGPFVVSGGVWSGPTPETNQQRWTWDGRVVAFRTGELEIPPIRITIHRDDGSSANVMSPAVNVSVRSVLAPEEIEEGESPELSDLKPPASLEPDYSGLWTAITLLLLLLVVAAVAWWLQRRFAAKLGRVETPQDRFHRVPPHVWAHAALQELLDRRLVEQGQIDSFFMELSRIVKLYLGGRYRVDLMERTSGEVPAVLEQARTHAPAIEQSCGLLALADQVKFAGDRPDPEDCRRAVESVYEIVDVTKPREEPETGDERSAA